MSLELEPGEKIDSWDVVVKTTHERELSFGELGLEIYYTVSKPIDATLEGVFPCTWNEDEPESEDDKCETCKKLGETICGNDTIGHQCYESEVIE